MVIGIMLTKDEGDIIFDVLQRWKQFDIPIIALDDSSDDTYEILQSFPNVYAFKQDSVHNKVEQPEITDGLYYYLLQKVREKYGINNYIVLALGDEFWYFNPLKIVNEMKVEKATYACLESLQFYPHITDRELYSGFGKFSNHKSAVYNLTHYSRGWVENRIFYDEGKFDYNLKQVSLTLPENFLSTGRRFSKLYYYGHYPLRNPSQILSRSKDRVDRNYQLFYMHSYHKKELECFYATFPGTLPHVNAVIDNTFFIDILLNANL